MSDAKLKRYADALDRRLDRTLWAIPAGAAGLKLHKRIGANRAHLVVFITNRAVPATNNTFERNLRPSVIFRKATNGFRCTWEADAYAAFRSVVSTAEINNVSGLETIRNTLNTKPTPAQGWPITNFSS